MKVDLIKEIIKKANSAEQEKVDFYGSNNQAAGKRCRKLLSEISKLCFDARADIQEENRNRQNILYPIKKPKKHKSNFNQA